MAEEIIDGGVQPPLGAPAPQEGAQAGGESAPPAQQAKAVQVPTSAFADIKAKAREQGAKDALGNLARELGFEDLAGVKAALARLKETPAQAPEKKSPQAEPGAEDDGSQAVSQAKQERRQAAATLRQLERLTAERSRYAQEAKQQEEAARAARVEADNLRAEMALREHAVRAGVQDVGYALHLFVQHVDKLSPAEAAKLDEAAWFQGLRKTHPYLFGEVVQPATTGNGAGAPPAPKPGEVAGKAAKDGKVDARTMSPTDFQKLLQERGLSATG